MTITISNIILMVVLILITIICVVAKKSTGQKVKDLDGFVGIVSSKDEYKDGSIMTII